MEAVHKLEETIGGWLKPIPHLPTEWRKWLATNAWWLNLIGAVLGAIAFLGLLGALSTALSWFGTVTSIYGVAIGQVYGGWWVFGTVVALVSLGLVVLLSAMAVSPLKSMSRKGWDLLFLIFLVEVVSMVANLVINFNTYGIFAGLIGNLIGVALGAYVLFEVREYFGVKTVNAKK